MQTTEEAYVDFLETKYRPGRDFYLTHFVYPRCIAEFSPGLIYDIGCGMGAFLKYCKKRNLPAKGFDSNPQLVERCQKKGLAVILEDIIYPGGGYPPAQNLICDNVLEHLTLDEIDAFFSSVKQYWALGGVLLVIVPNRRGYESDPTHKTFVDEKIVGQMAMKHQLTLARQYRHPIRWKFPGNLYVFNMTVFLLENRSSRSR
jgi:trans-aconitate methyltransferase